MFGNCWEHLIIVVTGVDYNPLRHKSRDDYIKALEKVEDEMKEIF